MGPLFSVASWGRVVGECGQDEFTIERLDGYEPQAKDLDECEKQAEYLEEYETQAEQIPMPGAPSEDQPVTMAVAAHLILRAAKAREEPALPDLHKSISQLSWYKAFQKQIREMDLSRRNRALLGVAKPLFPSEFSTIGPTQQNILEAKRPGRILVRAARIPVTLRYEAELWNNDGPKGCHVYRIEHDGQAAGLCRFDGFPSSQNFICKLERCSRGNDWSVLFSLICQSTFAV